MTVKIQIQKCGNEIINNLLSEIILTPGMNICLRGDFANTLVLPELQDGHLFYNIENQEQKFDLIISFFELTFIFDIEKYFSTLTMQLKDDGIFLGCFIGENSFLNLRTKLWELEESLYSKIYSRIVPMMRLQDLNSILYGFGLKNIVSFKDSIALDNDQLMQHLRNLKELRPRMKASYFDLFPKPLYHASLKSENLFDDKVEILGFIASKSTKMFATQIEL